MTTRRGFLGAILAAGVAPAAVGSGILMPVRLVVRPAEVEALSAQVIASLVGDFGVAAYRRALLHGDMVTIAGVSASDGSLQTFRVIAIPSSTYLLPVGAH